MIRILKKTKSEFSPVKDKSAILEKKRPPRQQLWIDIIGDGEDELEEIGRLFNIHPLAIEDCLTSFHLPKVDLYPGYLFLVFQSLIENKNIDEGIEWKEIDIFFGKNYLITYHRAEIKIIEQLFSESHGKSSYGKDIGEIFYHIIDNIVENYIPILDKVSDEIDRLEDKIISQAQEDISSKIIGLRRKLINLRKVMGPERNIILELSERIIEFYPHEMKMYFMDIYDHLFRVADIIDTYRDIIAGTMEIYLSTISNRMNEIMKVLTIIATIIFPLTLITGIYGMNFRYMPELYWRYSYFFVLILMGLISGVMIIYFKRKRWL